MTEEMDSVRRLESREESYEDVRYLRKSIDTVGDGLDWF